MAYIDNFPECKNCKHVEHDMEYIGDSIDAICEQWSCRLTDDGKLQLNCKVMEREA